MENQQLVADQYGAESLQARVAAALEKAGLAGTIAWPDLAPLDQFHVRGLAATKELAEALNVPAGAEVLDVGCGLGGPARLLAATTGCRVTGVDLSQPFVEIAMMLTERCGLSAQVDFRQADALALPFDDGSFDHAWTQHVAMNIADRATLYSEIHRVLKPGGRLAIYDVMTGDGRPPIFPVPWARRPEMSFLLTPEAMREVLVGAGFVEVSTVDKTEAGKQWIAALSAGLPSSPPLGLPVVMGPQFAEMAGNLGRNLQEGRVRLVQTIVTRS